MDSAATLSRHPASSAQPPSRRTASLVGAAPVPMVHLMEDHDEALARWRETGLRNRLVVHIDAHIDFGWMPDRHPLELLEVSSIRELEEQAAQPALWNFSGQPDDRLISIGNYLNPALREGIVREWYWVAPDGFFGSSKEVRRLENLLKTLQARHPGAFGSPRWDGAAFHAEVYGAPLTVCRLGDLPPFTAPVLLDIDTDFLMIHSLAKPYPHADFHRARPWIWPEELIDRLHAAKLQTDLVTIAYSVEGGYTPLPFKYLGDELAERCRTSNLPLASRTRYARTLQLAECRGRTDGISEADRSMAGSEPETGDAAILYQCALLFLERGQVEAARSAYSRAIALDPTYRTAYNNGGVIYLCHREKARAEAEFRNILMLDPQQVEACYGLADLYAWQQRWPEALEWYQRAFALNKADPRGRLGPAFVALRRKQWRTAETLLLESLTIEEQGQAHAWLGLTNRKLGRPHAAIAAYRSARRLGAHGPGLAWQLAKLYLRTGNLTKAGRELRKVMQFAPRWLRGIRTRCLNHLREWGAGMRGPC